MVKSSDDILTELLFDEIEFVQNQNKLLIEYITTYDKMTVRYQDKINLLNFQLFISNLKLNRCKTIK